MDRMTDRLANRSWSHIMFPDAALQAAIHNNLYTELQEAPEELKVTCKLIERLIECKNQVGKSNAAQRVIGQCVFRLRCRTVLSPLRKVLVQTGAFRSERSAIVGFTGTKMCKTG